MSRGHGAARRARYTSRQKEVRRRHAAYRTLGPNSSGSVKPHGARDEPAGSAMPLRDRADGAGGGD